MSHDQYALVHFSLHHQCPPGELACRLFKLTVSSCRNMIVIPAPWNKKTPDLSKYMTTICKQIQSSNSAETCISIHIQWYWAQKKKTWTFQLAFALQACLDSCLMGKSAQQENLLIPDFQTGIFFELWIVEGFIRFLSSLYLKNQHLTFYLSLNYLPLTSWASITVATPTVRAMVGTLLMSLSKKRALATMVSFARVFTLVLDFSDDPGSLNAIWPSSPIPVKIIG